MPDGGTVTMVWATSETTFKQINSVSCRREARTVKRHIPPHLAISPDRVQESRSSCYKGSAAISLREVMPPAT